MHGGRRALGGQMRDSLFERDVHILRNRFFSAEDITGDSRIVRAGCPDQGTKSAYFQRRRPLLREAHQKGGQNHKRKGN
jgi:hypothetical protein